MTALLEDSGALEGVNSDDVIQSGSGVPCDVFVVLFDDLAALVVFQQVLVRGRRFTPFVRVRVQALRVGEEFPGLSLSIPLLGFRRPRGDLCERLFQFVAQFLQPPERHLVAQLRERVRVPVPSRLDGLLLEGVVELSRLVPDVAELLVDHQRPRVRSVRGAAAIEDVDGLLKRPAADRRFKLRLQHGESRFHEGLFFPGEFVQVILDRLAALLVVDPIQFPGGFLKLTDLSVDVVGVLSSILARRQ